MKIYYQDEEIIVLEKPYGVSSQSARGENVLSLLMQMGTEAYCVHRLDTQTTGVMVYAKTKQSASFLSNQIANGVFFKEYISICHGVPENYGCLTDFLYHDKLKNKSFVAKTKRAGSKEAKLEFWTQGSTKIGEKETTLLKILLHTGRTHQIRVQFASRGFALYGDGKYGAKDNDRIMLHCYHIEFVHPNGKKLSFYSRPDYKTWSYFDSCIDSLLENK